MTPHKILNLEWAVGNRYWEDSNIVRAIAPNLPPIFVCDCLSFYLEEEVFRDESIQQIAEYIVKIHNQQSIISVILQKLAAAYEQNLKDVSVVAQYGGSLPTDDTNLTDIPIEIGLLKEAHRLVNAAP